MSETPAPPGATTYTATPPQLTDTSWHFVRSANGRIGGVCESVSVATGVDVGLVRLATIGAALWGPGLIAYLALMVAVPRADDPADPRIRPAPPNVAKWIRVALAVGGGLGAATLLGGIGWAHWPIGAFYRDGGAIGLTLIAIAIAVIVLRRREGPPPAPSSTLPPPVPPSPTSPPPAPTPNAPMPGAPMPEPTPPTGDASGPPSPDTAAPDGPETATPEAVVRDAAPPPPPPANGVDRTQPLPLSPIAPASDPAVGAPPPAPTRTDADDNRVALLITRITGWLVILAALAVAVALMATIRLGILELRLGFLLWPLALVAFVAACVAVIRARSIAVISATLASLVLVWGIGALATRFDGPTGTRTIVVTDGGDLAPRYHLAAGWLTVDLGSLSIEEPTRVEIENRAGRVDVVVPDDAAVEVDANVWAGRSDVLGSVVEGWRVDDSVREVPRGTTAVLTIDLDVGVGAARLCRASDAGADHRCDR